MNQPFVSIIVPVYNGGKYIAETLKSITAQCYNSKEIIVVDDGSTDQSKKIVNSFDIKYIYQGNRGVPSARNRGIKEAKGEFIAFSDQDDVWMPDKLEKQVEFLMQHSTIDYVICKRKIQLESGVSRPSWLKEELLYTEDIDHSPTSLVARSNTLKKIGMFDTGYKNASDVDWFFRAENAGLKKGIIHEVLYKKRIHSSNQSSRVRELHKEYLHLIHMSLERRKK